MNGFDYDLYLRDLKATDDDSREDPAAVHEYDPSTSRCTCGALDHPEWGVTA